MVSISWFCLKHAIFAAKRLLFKACHLINNNFRHTSTFSPLSLLQLTKLFFSKRVVTPRDETILERLDGSNESASFEITALFTRLYGEGKSAAISRVADILDPSRGSYTVLALVSFSYTMQDGSFLPFSA